MHPLPNRRPMVRQDHADKGELAGRLLIARLRGKEGKEAAEGASFLIARLVERGSTGPPPSRAG